MTCCLLQIVRVFNGSTPEGADWHRRLLDRLTVATEHRPALLSADTVHAQGLLLGFRHGLRSGRGWRWERGWTQAGRCPQGGGVD